MYSDERLCISTHGDVHACVQVGICIQLGCLPSGLPLLTFCRLAPAKWKLARHELLNCMLRNL